MRQKKVLFLFAVILSAFLLAPGLALAAEKAPKFNALDNVWTMIAAFLVYIMQAGFALVEAGMTRSKNAGNIAMKNMMDFAVGSLAYWIVGFGLMFGAGNLLFGTSGWFAESKAFEHLGLALPLSSFLMFQTVFAATAATIVSGAMAERTKYSSYLIYSAVITALVYPVVGHWAWGGGWLSKLGFIDFAGSTVVHSVGGWAALAGVIILGPRIGKYNKDGSANAIPGHNLVYAVLGVFLLWFGWFGFNPGSTLAASDNIGDIAVHTNLAAAAGAVMAMIGSWLKYKKADVGMTMNGALAGLVAITAGCATVSNAGSFFIGALAGLLVIFSIEFFDRIHADDAVGAVSVHAVCGSFGTLMVGLFATEGGLFYGGGWRLLGVQSLGVLSTFLWVFLSSLLLFSLIKATVGLRVSPQEELEGLDIHEHGTWAYPDRFTVSDLEYKGGQL